MFLKQERPEWMILKEEEKIGSKGNILFQYFKKILGEKFEILTNTLAKISIFLHISFVSEYFKHFCFILRESFFDGRQPVEIPSI